MLIPLVFEVVFVTVLSYFLFQVEQEARTIERSRDLILETETLQRQCLEMGATVAGYSFTENPIIANQFGESKTKVLIQLGILRDLVNGDPELTASVMKISDVVQNEVAHLQNMLDQIDREISNSSRQFEKINVNLVRLSILFDDLVKRQRQLLRDAPQAESRLRSIVEQLVVVGVALNIAIALGLVAYFNAGTTRRLNILMENTTRLGSQKELLPPTGGDDEIARLDQVFRGMAYALSEATRKEKAIVDNASDVICTLDEDLKFSAVSRACEARWGYLDEDLLGRRLVDIIFERTDEVSDTFRKIIQNPRTDAVEIRIRSKSNRPVDTLWSVQWSDVESQFFCLAYDITEQKRIDQIRRDLVAMVSHDLRSPLTAIMVGLEHLRSGRKGTTDESLNNYLERMEVSASRMVRLINDFLDLEKLQSGKLELKIARINLDVLVGNSVQAIRPLTEVNRITIQEQNTDIDLSVDGDRLIQVLVNLLSNAIKFSPPGGVIVVTARVDGADVEISVSDQGPGLKEDQQSVIFENFSQLEKDVRPGSSGLGLSICKNLVELHGGTIGVRSVLGQGSTFWFRLPQAQLTDSEAL